MFLLNHSLVQLHHFDDIISAQRRPQSSSSHWYLRHCLQVSTVDVKNPSSDTKAHDCSHPPQGNAITTAMKYHNPVLCVCTSGVQHREKRHFTCTAASITSSARHSETNRKLRLRFRPCTETARRKKVQTPQKTNSMWSVRSLQTSAHRNLWNKGAHKTQKRSERQV